MKNKLLILLAVFTGVLLLSSCYKETKLWHTPESGDIQYAQLMSGDILYEMNKLDASGNPSDVSYQVYVKVMGPVPTSDVNVTFEVTTTGLDETYRAATPDMYSFGAANFVVPAGQDYGMVTLTMINAALPLDTAVSFILKLAEGTVKPASVANEIVVSLLKNNYCPWLDADLVGNWGGTDGAFPDYLYPANVDISMDAEQLKIIGLNYGWISDFWGETVTSATPVNITFNLDGTVDIPPQYYFTTDYLGNPYDYNIYGSGTWNNCTGELHIEYEMDQDGFLCAAWCNANGYSDYPYFVADITLNAKNLNLIKPVVEHFVKPVR
jgi:hypothetical protein